MSQSANYARSAASTEAPRLTRQMVESVFVGKRYFAFEGYFSRFKSTGRYALNFSFPAFFMTYFWYFYRKMYRPGLIMLGINVVLIVATEIFGAIPFILTSIYCIFLCIFCAVCGRWHYWKHTNRCIDEARRLFPGQQGQALGWLENRGGVAIWALAVFIAMNVLVVIYVLYIMHRLRLI